jgi:hypothetical protein
MQKINLNETVTVTLTGKGLEIFKNYCQESLALVNKVSERNMAIEEYVNKFVFENSKIRVHLWELFKIFGEECYLGCDVPFEDNEITIN